MGAYLPPRRWMRRGSQAARCLAVLGGELLAADEVAAGAGLTREQASMTLSRLVSWGWVEAEGPAGSQQTGCTRRYRRR